VGQHPRGKAPDRRRAAVVRLARRAAAGRSRSHKFKRPAGVPHVPSSPRSMSTCFVVALAALLALAHPIAASATVQQTLDAYSLFATESMRVRNFQAGDGDLGVNQGSFLGRGTLDAPSAQIVANSVDLAAGARCGALYVNAGKGDGIGPACATA